MYPEVLRTRTTGEMRTKYPVEWVEKAVHGMIPHNKLGNKIRTHLFVYEGEQHSTSLQTCWAKVGLGGINNGY